MAKLSGTEFWGLLAVSLLDEEEIDKKKRIETLISKLKDIDLDLNRGPMRDDDCVINNKKRRTKMAETDGLPYCVIRTYSAGVHIGYLKDQNGKEVKLVNARRLWRWSNAASLSQVAVDGCESDKFTVAVPEIIITEAIEIIPCTEKAREVLEGIAIWKC